MLPYNRFATKATPSHGKSIILVGIAFDKEKRNISDWKSERV